MTVFLHVPWYSKSVTFNFIVRVKFKRAGRVAYSVNNTECGSAVYIRALPFLFCPLYLSHARARARAVCLCRVLYPRGRWHTYLNFSPTFFSSVVTWSNVHLLRPGLQELVPDSCNTHTHTCIPCFFSFEKFIFGSLLFSL